MILDRVAVEEASGLRTERPLSEGQGEAVLRGKTPRWLCYMRERND